MKNIDNELKNLSIIIVTHVYATGPSFKLEEYLRHRVKKLILIGHPFSFAKERRSFIRVYDKGNKTLEKKFINWTGSEFLFYFKDMMLTFWWYLIYAKRTDYFIGVNNFNVFAGFLLGFIAQTGKLVFYTIDYVPERFENKLLNSFYHWLDRLAVYKSYKVWNLSSIMVSQREKNGVDEKYRAKQLTVPIGTDIREFLDFSEIDRNKIIFLGHLRKGQGIEILVSAMKIVIGKRKLAKLLIIGGGPLEDSVSKMIKKLGLEKNVELTGFISDYDEVKKLMSDAAVAVAPYVDDKKTYTRYTDPGKPKDYLACGLPVVITKVPRVAFEIQDKGCGIAVDYDEKEIANAILKILGSEETLRTLRQNAIKMAREYEWEKVFGKAFQQTL